MRDCFIFYTQCFERVRLIGAYIKLRAKIYDKKELRVEYEVIPVEFG